jgi:hypothetical protein
MHTVAWQIVAHEFTFDGSYRDIYVLDADLQGWQRVLDRLRQEHYELVYHRAGNVSELPPAAADAFPADGEADRMLSVRFADVLANCHFFTRDEIEFDIDPREVQGQRQLDALFAFMRLLSEATGKDAVLTPANCRDIGIFRTRLGRSAIDYHKFGGWGAAE